MEVVVVQGVRFLIEEGLEACVVCKQMRLLNENGECIDHEGQAEIDESMTMAEYDRLTYGNGNMSDFTRDILVTFGIAPATIHRLRKLGINTLEDLSEYPQGAYTLEFGHDFAPCEVTILGRVLRELNLPTIDWNDSPVDHEPIPEMIGAPSGSNSFSDWVYPTQ